MTLQEKIQKLEEKLIALAANDVPVPTELAENMAIFERVVGQMLQMADEALVVAPLKEMPALQQSPTPESIPYDTSAQSDEIFVLLVEDNVVNQKLAVLILEKVGCQVDVAENGAEGVKKFKTGNYVAIFMDCQMPVLDGYDATRAIRELEADGSRIPIIAVTANAMKGDREKCLECGMDDYIAKPIMPNDLHEAVSRWCQNSV